MKLSKHFNLEEFTKSMTAQRKGIDNTPGAGDIKNLHSDMNKGKGVISFLIIVGGLVGATISFFKWNG